MDHWAFITVVIWHFSWYICTVCLTPAVSFDANGLEKFQYLNIYALGELVILSFKALEVWMKNGNTRHTPNNVKIPDISNGSQIPVTSALGCFGITTHIVTVCLCSYS